MADSVHSHLGQGVYSAAPDSLLALLRKLGKQQNLAARRDLFNQGDDDDALYVLLTGNIELSALAPDGRRLALILLRPGTIFGEMALFDGGTRSATATAKNACTLLRIERTELIEAIRNNPDLSIEMLKLTIGRLRWMSAQLEDHAFQTVSVRLAHRLNILLQTIGEGNVIRISQSDLAEHAGATREAVSKTLSDWREQGMVEIGRSKITILDLQALQNIGAHKSI